MRVASLRAHFDAWRLPAEQSETLFASILRQHLTQPGALAALMGEVSAADLAKAQDRLPGIASDLTVIDRCDLSPGSLKLCLNRERLAKVLECTPDRIDPAALTFAVPFQARRRGLELNLGAAPPEIDRTLVADVAKARRWLAMLLGGNSFSEIAQANGALRRCVQDVIELALLAPDILDKIALGEQPDALTTDYLTKTGMPVIWSEQRGRFAAL